MRSAISNSNIDRPIVAQSHALAAVFEANVDAVFSFLVVRSGSRDVASEVASETFAEAARAFRDGQGSSVTEAWLIHVARLRLIDFWRRSERHRRRVRKLRLVRHEPHQDRPHLPDPAVMQALDALADRQRQALVLRYLDDYSVEQVAQAMKLSYPATESLLARARKSFSAAYTDQEVDR